MEEYPCIVIKSNEEVQAQSIYKDANGVVWLIRTAYRHDGVDFATAIQIPEELPTFKIVEEVK